MTPRLGQHFLRDTNVLSRIAQEALATDDSSPMDCIVEIGPGHGELTDALLVGGAQKILAIEKDRLLARKLREKYQSDTRVKTLEGDVRKILPALHATHPSLLTAPHVVVGNIPYYLTGFLFRLLGDMASRSELRTMRIVLLVQKEVAMRAAADTPHMNLLAATIRGWARPRIAFSVPRGSFSPPPKVTSALLTLEPERKMPQGELAHYLATAKKLFRQPRKTLANNIREGFSLTKARAEAVIAALGIEKNARAAKLTPQHIKTLAKMMYN